jgi:PEGA domain-containing protein
MRLNKTVIPIAALTLAMGAGGSVAQGAQRDRGQDRSGQQSEGHARQRSRSGGDQRNDAQEQRQNNDRASRDNDRRSQSSGRAENRGDNRNGRDDRRDNGQWNGRDNGRWNGRDNGRWNGRDNGQWDRRDNRGSVNGFRGYASPRPRFDVVRPRFDHHYGPNFSVFFGIGSGYRYGSPYRGRVYGYVPAPMYGARIYYGDVRLQVNPRDAAVFVDGYYAGVVDDFDGIFQRLTLTVGPHEIEIEAPGFEPQVYNVMVDPARTVDVRADLYPQYP